MCKYSLIKQMRADGTLKAAVNNGIVSSTVLGHTDIYEYFLKIKGTYDKRTAITVVSEDKKVCENLVYKIIKDFGC